MPVRNNGDSDLCLFIEPLGEDFWLKPGEAFTVGARCDGMDVWFDATLWKGGISVWLYEDGNPTKVVLDYAVVDANGKQLDCGHQRPADDRWLPAGPVMQ